ncbi:hypothetical protein EV562_10570 [Streptomyces sp. BK208]|nr:hypothetical protein EV562_10570 [Streptomyces sp. BK208]
MMHEIEDINQERMRLSRRPSVQETPPVVGVFDVRTSRPVAEFGARVRSVLDPALLSRNSAPGCGPCLIPHSDWQSHTLSKVKICRSTRSPIGSLPLPVEVPTRPPISRSTVLCATRPLSDAVRGIFKSGCTSSIPNPSFVVGRGGVLRNRVIVKCGCGWTRGASPSSPAMSCDGSRTSPVPSRSTGRVWKGPKPGLPQRRSDASERPPPAGRRAGAGWSEPFGRAGVTAARARARPPRSTSRCPPSRPSWWTRSSRRAGRGTSSTA